MRIFDPTENLLAVFSPQNSTYVQCCSAAGAHQHRVVLKRGMRGGHFK